MTRLSIFGIFLLLLFTSCKKKGAPDFHLEYFGMETGRYVIYDVEEITHDSDLAVQHDTVRYQLKTVWEGEYVDNEGRTTSIFRRYKRNTDTDVWEISDIWTGVYDGIRAELIEENQRVVKLVFAPSFSKSWDANAYNNNGELDCYYSRIHFDTIIGGVEFDSTVIVEQGNYTPTLIDTLIAYEIYGKNVGMLYKHFKDNKYNIGDSIPRLGREVYYHYVSHGFE